MDAYEQSKREGLVVDPKGTDYSFDPIKPYATKYVLRGAPFCAMVVIVSGSAKNEVKWRLRI
ncbi:hypothetical protein MASR2M41_11460 [Flammeovirgaceae bacterium]